jgi:hypothetical protein
MAYFPNDLENAKAMMKALSNIINKLKNKSVVLTAKNTNAATIQTILDTYVFKDL